MERADHRTSRSSEEDLDLPDELIDGLGRMDKAVAVVSPETDRRIAEAARIQFGQRRRGARAAWPRWAMAGSLAASLLVGVVFWRAQAPLEERELMVATVARVANHDIDGSGAVDILDAFALARMAREDRAPGTQEELMVQSLRARSDVSPDTRAKIDALAKSIVALDGPAEKP